MFHLIWGEDTYSVLEAADRLVDSLVDPSFRAMNLSVLEGPVTPPSQAIAAAQTIPFMGERVVVVKDCPYFSAGKYEGSDEAPALVEAFEKGLPSQCHLVFVVPKGVDKRLSPTKVALSACQVKEFPLAKPWESARMTVEWVGQYASQVGGTLAPRTAQALVDKVGVDRWRLGSEVDKLLVYTGGRPVTPEDVDAVSPPGETDVFAIIEAVMGRRSVDAVIRARRLLVTEPALRVVATMATMLRQWLHLKLMAERGMGAAAIAQQLGAKSSFKIEKDLERCRGWNSRQLTQALKEVLAADAALKRGGGKPYEILQLESLIAKLTRLDQ